MAFYQSLKKHDKVDSYADLQPERVEPRLGEIYRKFGLSRIALRDLLEACVDRELFAAIDGRVPLARRRLPHREGQDPYDDVGVLLRHITHLPLPEDFAGVEGLVKGVYQLAAALDADSEPIAGKFT